MDCDECNGTGKVDDVVPCSTCGGKGFIIVNGKPQACPGGCSWGQVKTGQKVTCLECNGTGKK